LARLAAVWTESGAGTLHAVPTGLRERKKRAVRTALEQTALRLFMEKGYENTTVEEITESVDVSTRTFFRYFATKDEVLFAHQADRLASIRAFFTDRPANETLADTVRAIVDFFAEDLEANQELLVVQATVYSQARLPAGIIRLRQDELIEAIAAGLARKLGRGAGIRPVVIATATMCAIELAAREWFRGGRQDDLRDAVRSSYGELIQTLAI
jgi:AcrR family transcriptional regulator